MRVMGMRDETRTGGRVVISIVSFVVLLVVVLHQP